MNRIILVLIVMISTTGTLLAQPKAPREEWTVRALHAGIDDLVGLKFGMPLDKNWKGGLSAFYRVNSDHAQTWSDDGHQEYSYMCYAFVERELGSIILATDLDLVMKFSAGLGVAMKRETFCEDVVEHTAVMMLEPLLHMRWKLSRSMTITGGFSLFHSPTFTQDAMSSLPKGTVGVGFEFRQ
jgi:hypothetical protein